MAPPLLEEEQSWKRQELKVKTPEVSVIVFWEVKTSSVKEPDSIRTDDLRVCEKVARSTSSRKAGYGDMKRKEEK
jgi:hypothetical protein